LWLKNNNFLLANHRTIKLPIPFVISKGNNNK
jgi:hypothetical protein